MRRTLAVTKKLRAFTGEIPAAPHIALPMLMDKHDRTAHLKYETIHIGHHRNAHTNDDSFVYFQSAKLIHAQDTCSTGFYPSIDEKHRGWVTEMIRAADPMPATSDEGTRIIRGHRLVADKAALRTFRGTLVSIRNLVRTAKLRNQLLARVVESDPVQNHRCKRGKGFSQEQRLHAANILPYPVSGKISSFGATPRRRRPAERSIGS